MRIHDRGPLPFELELIAGEPTVTPAVALCVEAWHCLGSERQIGFGAIGAIPFRAILAWAELHLLAREATMLLVAVLSRLDADRSERDASARSLKAGSS